MEEERNQGLKMFVVDDDGELLDTLSIVLPSMGHEVTCVESGAEGIWITCNSSRRSHIRSALRATDCA